MANFGKLWTFKNYLFLFALTFLPACMCGVTDSQDLPRVCYQLNSGTLAEKLVLLTIQSSLHPYENQGLFK